MRLLRTIAKLSSEAKFVFVPGKDASFQLKEGPERSKTKYRILEETAQPDGSVILKLNMQYSLLRSAIIPTTDLSISLLAAFHPNSLSPKRQSLRREFLRRLCLFLHLSITHSFCY